jgi:hypothetical protein
MLEGRIMTREKLAEVLREGASKEDADEWVTKDQRGNDSDLHRLRNLVSIPLVQPAR